MRIFKPKECQQLRKSPAMSQLFIILVFTIFPIFLHAKNTLSQDWVVTNTQVVENDAVVLNGNLIIENGGNLTLSGVTLTMNNTYNGEYGIHVKSGGAITIENGAAVTAFSDSAHFSFAVDSGSQFLMKDSVLNRCGWGSDNENIWVKDPFLSGMRGLVIDTNNAVIENNDIYDNYIGVILTGTSVILNSNHFHSNRIHGVLILEGTSCQIINNDIQHSSIGSPLWMLKAQDNIIKRNNISLSTIDRPIIGTMFSHGNTIEENEISGMGIGVALMFISNNNTVRGNTISPREAGIWVSGWNNRVESNIITYPTTGTITGIYMVYAYNSILSGNTISNITSEGFWLKRSSNNSIFNNKISEANFYPYGKVSSSAFLLMGANNYNAIYGNTTTGFLRGISVLFSSNGNTITNNEISKSEYQAIAIDDSTDNIIFGNNFINYGKMPYDNGENQWDLDGMGNHWSEYVGTDTNEDGVGNTPYMIGPEGADNYPLMMPVTVGSLPAPEVILASPPAQESLLGKTVTGEEVIENQTIVLNNINIESGGSLILRNVNFITGASDLWSNISVASGGSLYIYDCTFKHVENGYGFGITPYQGSNFELKNSYIDHCGDEWWAGGLQINTDNAVIENNVIKDSAITVSSAKGVVVTRNTISDSYWAINIDGSSDITVSNNTINNCVMRGIGAYNSSDILIKNNTVSDIWGDGIGVWLISGSQILGNSISNMLEGCFGAIVVLGSNGEANENIVSGCSSGIILGHGNNAHDNRVSNCYVGIDLSGGNYLAGNVVSNCDTGINVNGEANQIIGNTFPQNQLGTQVGLWGNNLIYKNNFINNVIQAFTENSDNRWNDHSEGNYWSDYTGMDDNGDGIGDVPYYIDPDGVDNYPLALPEGFGIDSINPKRNAEDISVDTKIAITFTKIMNASTITSNTFKISDGSNNIVGNIAYYETTAMFSPDNDFDYSKIYTVTLTNGAEDMAGNPLMTDFVWSFTTLSEDVNGSNGDGSDGNGGSSGGLCFIETLGY